MLDTMTWSVFEECSSPIVCYANPSYYGSLTYQVSVGRIKLRCFKRIERHANSFIADGVEADLKACVRAFDGHAREFFGRVAWDAAVVRVVGEGREHGGGVRSQCAVHVAFEHGQTDAERIDLKRRKLRALSFQLLNCVLKVLPLGHTNRQLVCAEQLAVKLDVLITRIVLNRSDTIAPRLCERTL